MFLRHKIRDKYGKRHRYWSVVENKRVAGGRVVQRHVLHLGEINGRELLLTRYTQPEPELTLIVNRLKLEPPRPAAAQNHSRRRRKPPVVPTCGESSQWSQPLSLTKPAQSANFG
jgi:hypothetical protein